ncbi:MAG: acyl-CoA dehydrogenase [Gammaproteobacteria bacterium]|nr:acyl-CoA dehydrogenase [Gammaproteobacteria bacterium]MYF02221.1 acyl-CoA dehydrogenase [Gammaproteobacteria bacterium]MYI76925.1 acyl-CoA dehydrogenase [Gammaproteobacteria bacterium]
MNFEFSKEQDLLREQARAFLTQHCPTTVVRKILEGNDPFDRDLWRKIAELGWQATVIPEEYGGLGLTYYELAVIAEELGRALAPTPFSSSVYLASELLLRDGSPGQRERWLPKLANGETIGTLAFVEDLGRSTPRNIQTIARNGKISGRKIAVTDGDVADFVIVLVMSDKGNGTSLYCVESKEFSYEIVDSIDPTRSHATLEFNRAYGELIGTDGYGWETMNAVFDRAAILIAWEQVGGTESTLAQATEYAKSRYAFGRPIGSFQAIKYKLANMYVKHTLARSNCYYGTWTLAGGHADLPLAAATCRVSAIQAYYYATKENIQTHGGMGFTWEFDCQLYYRRAKLLALNLGSEHWWQDRLITAHEQRNKVA